MKIRAFGVIAALVAAVAVGSVDPSQAEEAKKPKKGPAAMGMVKSVSGSSFVLNSKKAGEVTVNFDASTEFKKAPAVKGEKPADATAADLKEGAFARVQGEAAADGKMVKAKRVIIGGGRKAKKPAAQ